MVTTELWRKIAADPGTPAYYAGSWRSAHPRETLRRLQPLRKLAGITRLADVTRLDNVGVPVFQSCRPNSRNISVSNGKGLTRDQAKVSALMEGIETFHAEDVRQDAVRETVGAMRRRIGYDPFTLAVTRSTRAGPRRGDDYDPFMPPTGTPHFLKDQTCLDWIGATDLGSGASSWLPRELCELNFCVEERLSVPFFRATSNGLASGNGVCEALVHGLCEVVERDCVARNPEAWTDARRAICPATIENKPAQRTLKRFNRAGLKVRIIHLTNPAHLPAFEVYLSDADCALHRGYGCHPSRATALVRALTEAAQVRLAHLAGSRDDLFRETYRSAPHLPRRREHPAFAVAPCGDFRSCPDHAIGPWTDVLGDLIRRIQAMTGVFPLAVDLARPELGIPVVMVVAPGLAFLPPRRP